MLKDSFNRIHSYLRFSVTDRCNLRCRYCLPASGVVLSDRAELLTPEEIGDIVQLFADLGVRKVRLTGGEPLLRRGFDAILDQISAIHTRLQLALTTNGILLASRLDQLAAAGVKAINISLDTLKPQRFAQITGRDEWSKVWDAVQASLGHLGIDRVKINVVLQRGINDDEIKDFAQLTLKYPLDVRFIELMPVKLAAWRSHEWISNSEVLHRLEELEPSPISDPIPGPARLFRLPHALGRVGVISGTSCPACANCNRLRLTARGELLRCLFDPIPLNLRDYLRQGSATDDMKNQIKAFLLDKGEIGMTRLDQDSAPRFSPCLVEVGG